MFFPFTLKHLEERMEPLTPQWGNEDPARAAIRGLPPVSTALSICLFTENTEWECCYSWHFWKSTKPYHCVKTAVPSFCDKFIYKVKTTTQKSANAIKDLGNLLCCNKALPEIRHYLVWINVLKFEVIAFSLLPSSLWHLFKNVFSWNVSSDNRSI